ncbi:MAG: endonuclease [Tissierellia bacterium]|nr:endonuclease [Tissierellia bacterium]
MKKKSGLRKVLKFLLTLIIIGCVLFAGLLAYLTATEYKPEAVEDIPLKQGQSIPVKDEITLVSWNLGYGGLDEDTDFFMDGGKMVMARSAKAVANSLEGIGNISEQLKGDFYLYQEVDRPSRRSYHMDQVRYLEKRLEYPGQFARNFHVKFIPYPWPPMGQVESGILTQSVYQPTSSQRISLPVPFTYPVRLANLKRCLLVNRYPVIGEKELVLINLHLDAYDDGEGKREQSKVLMDLMKEEYEKGNFVIAGGDWNQSFQEGTLKYPRAPEGMWNPGELLRDEVPSNWTFAYDDSHPTSRLNNKPYEKGSEDTWYYVIDGYLVSPNVEVKEVKTIPLDFKYTDHEPVVLKAKLIK